MSESQPITPLAPTIHTSSLDSHRMISHASKPRPGTQQPLHGNIQAEQAGQGAVVLKDAPIEATMGGGGAVVVAKKAAHPTARQQPHPALAAKMSYQPGYAPRATRVAQAESPMADVAAAGEVEAREDTGTGTGAVLAAPTLTPSQKSILLHLVAERRAVLAQTEAPREAHAMLDDAEQALNAL